MSTILFVEDHASVRDSMIFFFEDLGYKVFGAENGKKGQEIVEQNHIDLAVVDIRLPDMSGEEVIIAALKMNPNLIIVILSGSLDYVISNEIQQLGITENDVFFKPISDLASFAQEISRRLK